MHRHALYTSLGRGKGIRNTNGSIMLLVLLLVLFLSFLLSFLSPMTIMYHQSIIHYRDNVELERFARGISELAVAQLINEWVDQYDSGWIEWDKDLQYRYTISVLDSENRNFQIRVKDPNVERIFQGVIGKRKTITSMLEMIEYGVYSNEDLSLLDLSKIYSAPPLIGFATLKNVKIFTAELKNRLTMHINGNIYLECTRWETILNYCDFSPLPLPGYNRDIVDKYICLLDNNYSDKMVIEGNQYLLNINLNTLSQERPILILEKIEELNITGSYNGLIIIRDCDHVVMEDVNLSGVLIVSNSNLAKMGNTSVTGMSGFVDSVCLSPLDLTLYHDVEILDGLYDYLSLEFAEETLQEQLYIQEFKESQ